MVRKSRREPAFKMWLADYAGNDLSARIWSLEARAASRDIEAMSLDEKTEEKERYALSLESSELRTQAQRLKKRFTDVVERPQFEDAAWIL
jgi:hypothetical protein